MADDPKNTTFYVTTSADTEYAVTAAYPAVDSCLFPGFVQLKDENGVIAALVRADHTTLIRRRDSDPTRAIAVPPREQPDRDAMVPSSPALQVNISTPTASALNAIGDEISSVAAGSRA